MHHHRTLQAWAGGCHLLPVSPLEEPEEVEELEEVKEVEEELGELGELGELLLEAGAFPKAISLPVTKDETLKRSHSSLRSISRSIWNHLSKPAHPATCSWHRLNA